MYNTVPGENREIMLFAVGFLVVVDLLRRITDIFFHTRAMVKFCVASTAVAVFFSP